MPTYEYECVACGHGEEIFHSMLDEPRRRCPKCKKMKFRRKIGMGAGLMFKGTGFYETDYRRKTGESGEGKSGKEGSDSKESPAPAKEKSVSQNIDKKPVASGTSKE